MSDAHLPAFDPTGHDTLETIERLHRAAQEIREQVSHSRELLVEAQETLKRLPTLLPSADSETEET